MSSAAITVRAATPEDRAFVTAAARRLADFSVPPWRTGDEIVAGEVRTLEGFFAAPAEGSALLVAESAGVALGFAYLEVLADYFSRRKHGHVGILAVAREAEGGGAAGALMRAAETWARSRDYGTLTLNVFEANRHARDVYEHLGFVAETLRYRKRLD